MRKRSGAVGMLSVLAGVALASTTGAQEAAPAAERPDALAQVDRSLPPAPRITLAEAIRRALAQNVSAAVALAEVKRAEALLQQARAPSLPTLTANGIYTRLDDERKFGTTTVAGQNQLAANLTLTVPIIVPQRWASWSLASSNVKTARASAEDVKRVVAVTTARAYIAIITQRHTVESDEHALQTAQAQFNYAHTRLLGGVGNRVDDVRAEQQVASNRSQLESSYAELARRREALAAVLSNDGPLDAAEEIPLATAPAMAEALEDAKTRRPDVIANKARWDAAEKARKNSYTDYLPFLLGVAQPFYQDPATLSQPKTGWQAQLLLTVPIYDGGLRYGLAAERAALSFEAKAQYESLVVQARSDVRVAFESVKRAEAALEAARSAARLAKNAAELADIAYRAGATTNLEVIDAERASHQADTAVAQAEEQANQARIDLLAATGRFP